MAEPRDDFAWIEAYLDGQLSPEERTQFEARLEAEPDLRSAKREQQEAIIALRLLEKEQLRQSLKQEWADLDQEAETDKQAQVRSFVRPLYWAAAIAAVVLLLFWVLRPQTEFASSQELAMAYFDPAPEALTKSGSDTSQFAKAMALYRAKDYQGAEIELLAIMRETPSENAQFYLALSQMAQQKWSAAGANLQALIDHPVWGEQVRWNQLLLALQEGREQEVDKLLEEILGAPRHYKQSETKALQSDWQSLKTAQ
ncbi:MAG: hypothetical protein AAFQ68_06445 [Bacteroidota bacterium]